MAMEGSFEFLTGQLKAVHEDLLAFQARTEQGFEEIDRHFEQIDGRFGRVEGLLLRLETKVRGLRKDMPGIVSDAMRAVLREPQGKSRKKSS